MTAFCGSRASKPKKSHSLDRRSTDRGSTPWLRDAVNQPATLESRPIAPISGAVDNKPIMRNLSLSLAAAAIALAAAPARADTVTFTGFTHGAEVVNYSVLSGATMGSASAGGFSTILNGGPSFETYCIDLLHTIAFGVPYTNYNQGPHSFNNPSAVADLGRLFSSAGSVLTSVQEAAFQMAVWEITYETSGSYGFGGGTATFSSAAAGVTTQAQTYLTGLASGSPIAIKTLESFATANDSAHQAVVYAPVPEPETYALMLAGLAAMGFIARRRRT